VPTTSPTAEFHDFPAYEALVTAARAADPLTYLVVLLGGEAGLRCGEIMALQWRDVDLARMDPSRRHSRFSSARSPAMSASFLARVQCFS
jgi:integrase